MPLNPEREKKNRRRHSTHFPFADFVVVFFSPLLSVDLSLHLLSASYHALRGWFLERVWPPCDFLIRSVAASSTIWYVNVILVYYAHSTVIVGYCHSRLQVWGLYTLTKVHCQHCFIIVSIFKWCHITPPLPMWRWPLQFNCLPLCDNGLQYGTPARRGSDRFSTVAHLSHSLSLTHTTQIC